MKIFHVATDTSLTETEALKAAQPPHLLLSYFYFRNKPLEKFVAKIGYTPEIILDSGAFSAWRKEKGIALTDYMKYLDENASYITHYINLDVMGDNDMSYAYYEILKNKGYHPVPVVQYGDDHDYWFKKYYAQGERFIALGGTVPIHNKWEVSDWVRMFTWQYPEVKFHLLGSSSRKIIDHCDMYSCDSSTWLMQAINGTPKHIKGRTREAKTNRAIHNLKEAMALASRM